VPILQKKNDEEGDRELITTGGEYRKLMSFVMWEMYWIARLDYRKNSKSKGIMA